MRRLLLLSLLAALVIAVPARAADTRVIGPGVSAAGVDLSNRTVDDATALRSATLGPAFSRLVAVTARGRHFWLNPKSASFAFDARRTAKRAFYAGANRPAGDLTPVAVKLAIVHKRLYVRGWAQRVAGHVATPARNAGVRITLRHLYPYGSKPGTTIDARALAKAVDAALDSPTLSRKLTARTVPLRASVTFKDLAKRYGTVLTVDREHFTLRLFKQLKLSKSYPIAVGMAGLDTPAGLYAIHDKQVDPAWHVPTSSWAGSLAGSTIPGGAPDNPLRARWLGIADGVGIHGTNEDWSIGTRASHGCIRMHVADVIDLYPRVPVGTPVLIG
jgi:lipoprotein-anchoring transpeptidase ErfK/SrfK